MMRRSTLWACAAAAAAVEKDVISPAPSINSNSKSPEEIAAMLASMSTDKKAFIRAILDKDDDIFQLKRLHELSCHRVEQVHRRAIDEKEHLAQWTEGSHVNRILAQTGTFSTLRKT